VTLSICDNFAVSDTQSRGINSRCMFPAAAYQCNAVCAHTASNNHTRHPQQQQLQLYALLSYTGVTSVWDRVINVSVTLCVPVYYVSTL